MKDRFRVRHASNVQAYRHVGQGEYHGKPWFRCRDKQKIANTAAMAGRNRIKPTKVKLRFLDECTDSSA
jgi:hypothetical protein